MFPLCDLHSSAKFLIHHWSKQSSCHIHAAAGGSLEYEMLEVQYICEDTVLYLYHTVLAYKHDPLSPEDCPGLDAVFSAAYLNGARN